MKIAGVERRNKPNCLILWKMQEYSTKGWVYRDGQGWIFAELTPDELVEFKSYECGAITIPRMKVRLPSSHPVLTNNVNEDSFASWFAHCTMPQVYPQLLSKFHIHQITKVDPMLRLSIHIALGSYETWLWADEVAMCRELGCEITVHNGYGWREWGVPPEWKAPSMTLPRVQRKERTFIYALVDDLTREVRYVGKSDDPEKRLLAHLKDTENPAKLAWIRSLAMQNRKPQLIILEEVAIAEELDREKFWIRHYEEQGCILTNAISQDRLLRKEEVLWIQAHFHEGAIIRLCNRYPQRWLLLDSVAVVPDDYVVGKVIPIKHDGTSFKQSAMGYIERLHKHTHEVVPLAELRQKSRGELRARLSAHNPEEKAGRS